MSDETANPQLMLVHNVFFTLKQDSSEARQKLLSACHKYLKDHAGVVFFAAGTIDDELNRPVNDREFHVGLHVIFQDRNSHDAYQVSQQHVQFIEENSVTWEKVRVFDSNAS